MTDWDVFDIGSEWGPLDGTIARRRGVWNRNGTIPWAHAGTNCTQALLFSRSNLPLRSVIFFPSNQ